MFYPLFAFYGGTLFALTGALAVILGGSTILAFDVVTVAAIAAAYGGLFWLARQLGVQGVLAHAPAIVFVTSAYYVTDLYGRGAWAEFMAVSALPLVLAASLRLVRGRWRVGPVVCLVAATVVFSGSHNITLLWGSTLAVVALVLYWLLSGRSRELPWRRMLAVAGLIALGVGLNGWFLLPDVQLRTRHAHQRRTHRVERDGVLQHLRGDLRPAANGAKPIRDAGALRSGSGPGAGSGASSRCRSAGASGACAPASQRR